jgi:hypothetical protein
MAATAAQLAELRNRVRDVVLSPSCQKIDFDYAFSQGYGYNRCRINSSAFYYIALALNSKPANGRGITIRVEHLPEHVGADYNSATNVMRFPSIHFGQTTFERGLIVHECVHAQRDALGNKHLGRTRGVEEEASAYVAEVLFLIYETTANGLTPNKTTVVGDNDPVLGAAFDIATQIADTPGALVGVGDAHVLRQAILADKTYKFMRKNVNYVYATPNNGIRL